MKTRLFIFSTLCLAVLCLGSASIAMAQSVTGGGVIQFPDSSSVNVSVAARTGPAGIVHVGVAGQSSSILGNVVDLCVVEIPSTGTPINAAMVVTETTQSSADEVPPGSFPLWVFADNGRTGDRFAVFAVFDEFFPCHALIPFLPEYLAFSPDVLTLIRNS